MLRNISEIQEKWWKIRKKKWSNQPLPIGEKKKIDTRSVQL